MESEKSFPFILKLFPKRKRNRAYRKGGASETRECENVLLKNAAGIAKIVDKIITPL